jgi:hypothetical protein
MIAGTSSRCAQAKAIALWEITLQGWSMACAIAIASSARAACPRVEVGRYVVGKQLH